MKPGRAACEKEIMCLLLHVLEENENCADKRTGHVANKLDGVVLIDKGFDPRKIIEEIDDGDLRIREKRRNVDTSVPTWTPQMAMK